MLCYRPTRTVVEITHDTFFWLSSQRRLMKALLPLFAIVAATGLLCLKVKEDGTENILGFDNFWNNIFTPLCMNRLFTFPGGMELFYTFLAFATALVATPLLIRYFLYMNSLSRMTTLRVGKTLMIYIKPSLIVAIIAGIIVYLWQITADSGLIILVLPVTLILFFWLVPCVIMNIKPRWPDRVFEFLGAVILMSLLALLVCTMPLNIIEFVDISLSLFNNSLPLIDTKTKLMIFELLMKVSLPVFFCFAAMVMLAGSVIIHGSVYP